MGAAEILGGAGKDHLRHAIRVVADVTVPQTKDGPTLIVEPFVAYLVALRLRMLPSINLDDEPCLPARQIRDVRTNRQLSRELRSVSRQ